MSDNLAPNGTPPAPPEEDGFTALPVEPTSEEPEFPSTAELQTAEPPTEEELLAVEPQVPTTPELASEATATTEPEERPAAEETPESALVSEVRRQKPEMQDVFSDEYTYPRPKRGDILQGRIIAAGEEGMMVNLGLKREGLIPAHDLQRVGSDVVEAVSVGDEIPVFIVRPEHDQEGHIIVSWHRARQEQDWLDAQKLYETGDIWEADVKGYNRGGLIVPYGKIRGFIPASHVTGISRRMGQASLQARLAEMVGQTLPLKVLEVNRQKRRLIFSERIARRQWRARQREKLLNDLQEGDHVHGVVSNVCDFGAFVDIGGTDGLVHISELSWRRTKHPREVVRQGDEVDAYVLRVDRGRKRIGLSLRLMEPDPWEAVENNHYIGQLVTGVVTKLTDFGAFAALDDGIEGLIHISELADMSPRHPSEVVTPETVLPLIIVKIDSRRRRMGLSLKRVSEEEWYDWQEKRRPKPQPAEMEPSEEPEPEEIEAGAETLPSGELEPAGVEASGEPEPEEIEAAAETLPSGEPEPVGMEASGEPEPEEAEVGGETQPSVEAELGGEIEPIAPVLAEEKVPEPLVTTEAASFEPPDELPLEGPPPEEVQEPPVPPEAMPFEPPDELPLEGPPPVEAGT
jgi:small subunit ribosomal protein S1